MPALVPGNIFIGPTPPGYPQVIKDASGTTTGPGGFTSVSRDDTTLLGDLSDETYFEHWRSTVDVAPSGSVFVEVAPSPSGIITDSPLTVRAMMHDDGTMSAFSTRMLFDVYNLFNGAWLGWFSHVYSGGIELPSADVIYTISDATFQPNTDDGFTFADLRAAARDDGLNINLSAFVGNDEAGVIRLLRVYELYFGTQVGQTPLRRWPPVNHGIRHWPRSSGRRVGKSY